MGRTNFPVYKLAAAGATITTGAASARTAIPNDSTGARASFIAVAATVAAYVRPGDSAITAAAGDLLLTPGAEPVILDVHGQTHLAGIQVAAAGVVSMTPVEF